MARFQEKLREMLSPLEDTLKKVPSFSHLLQKRAPSIVLPEEGSKSDEDLQALAENLKIPFAKSLSDLKIDRHLMKVVQYAFVKKTMIFPVSEDEHSLTVATCDPLQREGLDELTFQFRKEVKMIFVPKEALLSAVHEYYQQDENAADLLLEDMAAPKATTAFDDEAEIFDILEDDLQQPPAVRLLNLIIGEAIRRGASDIHFDPDDKGLQVRLRIDGVLIPHLQPPTDLQSPLITRIKVMSKMDIAERRLPQDGRVKMRMGAKTMDFRVSTLPVSLGERVVMRLLDKGNVTLGLEYSGMPSKVLQNFRKLIACSEGMILVTGPTGSGKTTTLYSAISELQGDDVNIMTIEDPVEYRLKGIAQMGVHPKIGLTFATGLRHILRQDPDIIMIGEIRDKETAEIAIQSALTGHLVLSTLHTNDSCSAITRLVDMGIEPYLISSCCLGVLAQRLVRKVCPACQNKKPTPPCPVCLNSGYSGRCGIYELMMMTPDIRKQIAVSPEAALIEDIAKREGLQKLREHGNELVRQHITTESEIWRVTRGAEE